MDKSQLEIAAGRLRDAYANGAIAPPRDLLPQDDIDAAYGVQSINTDHWISEGRRIIGRKIGLTAATVQRQLGVDRPDFGVLLDDMLIPNRGTLAVGRALQPKVEGEIAFVMARDIQNPKISAIELLCAIEYALPAIEIVDSRIADWKITIADTVADNASSAFFVVGSEPRSLAGLDLMSCGMVLTIDGAVASLGAGAACLGHPLNAVMWLARELAARGDPLRAGDVVMSGALGPMVKLAEDSLVNVTIGGLGSAEFSYRRTPS